MTAPPKMWYQSRAVWANGLIAAALLVPAVRRALSSGDWTPAALVALALLNLYLRATTSQPVTFTGAIGQVGGTQFQAPAQIGAVVGDDANITEGK